MTSTDTIHPARSLESEERRGIAADLRLLAAMHGEEPTAAFLDALQGEGVEELFHLAPATADALEVCDFFEQALAATGRDEGALHELAADFAAIYLTYSHRVSPSESPWIDPEGLTSQESMFATRDWYRHYGLKAANWRKLPDDHLVAELVFLAHLFDLDDRPHAAADAARFLDRHLLRWYGSFCTGVVRRAWTPYWAAVAKLTGVYLESLRDRLTSTIGVEREIFEPIDAEKERRRAAQVQHETCAAPSIPQDRELGW